MLKGKPKSWSEEKTVLSGIKGGTKNEKFSSGKARESEVGEEKGPTRDVQSGGGERGEELMWELRRGVYLLGKNGKKRGGGRALFLRVEGMSIEGENFGTREKRGTGGKDLESLGRVRTLDKDLLGRKIKEVQAQKGSEKKKGGWQKKRVVGVGGEEKSPGRRLSEGEKNLRGGGRGPTKQTTR